MPRKLTVEEALIKFKSEIEAKSVDVDPGGERNWYDLAFGYGLGLGLDPDDAYTLATKAYYGRRYGG
jgi:hypothetical protein